MASRSHDYEIYQLQQQIEHYAREMDSLAESLRRMLRHRFGHR